MSNKKNIYILVGTRPSFIMASEIIKTLDRSKKINLKIVHSGQHYSSNMNDNFFRELKIRAPDIKINLKKNSSNLSQISQIINQFEKKINKKNIHAIIVLGDTNSNLAGALVARKLNIKLFHLEAGQRTSDITSQEEQNRRIIDTISDGYFCTNQNSINNLKKEGIVKNLYNTGHPIVEVIKKLKIDKKKDNQKNIFCTLHRSENVDQKSNLILFFETINNWCKNKKIYCIFPMHPRTFKNTKKFKINLKKYTHFILKKPLTFKNTINHIYNSTLVITDSGGIQQECYILKKNCLTFLKETPWPETLFNKCNILIDFKKKNLQFILNNQFKKKRKFSSNIFGNDKCSKKILNLINK